MTWHKINKIFPKNLELSKILEYLCVGKHEIDTKTTKQYT